MATKCLNIILFFILLLQNVKTKRNNACKNFLDYFIIDLSENCYYEPDVWKNTPEILQRHVNHFETFSVTTEDGYILTIFRIPPINPNKTRGVVVLQHPLSTDAINWVGQSNESLAFSFWRQGYDVWLPNNRGTYFSRKHVNLSVNDYEYWNFGFHEIGIYDYDTFFSFIKAKTNRNDLIFIGHSMSGSSSLAYASLKPEKAKDTIKVFIEMSPVTFLKDVRSPIKYAVLFMPLIQGITKLFKIGSFLGYNSLDAIFFKLNFFIPFKMLFVYMQNFVFGWTPKEFDPKLINLLLTQCPRAVSWKLFFHYGQIYKTKGKFPLFDYGRKKNLELYHSEIPPEYPLYQIRTPIYIISSLQDTAITTKDLGILYRNLPDEAKIYGNLTISGMNHVDFSYGKHRKEKVFDNIFNLLSKIDEH